MSNYKYDAFISYRHSTKDKMIAEKLQKLLETYRPSQKGKYNRTARIQRVFRDESELPTSGDLAMDIQTALEQSAFLIVVCSEETSKSIWCMKEIEYFKQLHQGNNENILTLLVSGNPHEVFPKELCYETKELLLNDGSKVSQTVEVEPLAANITAPTLKQSMKKLKTEFLRLAAPILGCNYDDLYQRHQKRFIQRIVLISSLIIGFALIFSSIVVSQIIKISNQADEILEKQESLNIQMQRVKDQQLLRCVNYANQLSTSGDKLQAAAILEEADQRFDKSSELYGEYKDELEVAAANTLYYPDYSAYAVLWQDSRVNAATFSEDGSLVATGSVDGMVILWDTTNAEKIGNFLHDSAVNKVKIYDHYLIVGTVLGTLYIWDIDSQELLKTYSEGLGYIDPTFIDNIDSQFLNQYGISDLTINENIEAIIIGVRCSKDIYYGRDLNYISIIPFPWKEHKESERQYYKIYSDYVMSENGSYVCFQWDDKCSSLITDRYSVDLAEGFNFNNMFMYLGIEDLTASGNMSLDNDGNIYYYSYTDNRYINVRNMFSNELLYSLENPFMGQGSIKPNNNSLGKFVLTDIYNASFFDLSEGYDYNEEYDLQFDFGEPLIFVTYFSNYDQIFISYAGNEDSSYVCNLDGEKKAKLTSLNGALSCAELSKNDEIILTASDNGKIILHHVKGHLIKNETYSGGEYTSGLSNQLLTVQNEGNNIYDIKEGKVIKSLLTSNKDYSFRDCIISEDSQFVLGMEYNDSMGEKFLRVWSTESCSIINLLELLNDKISFSGNLSYNASPNFQYIVAYIIDQVYIYSMKENRVLYTYPVGLSDICVFIENDGKTFTYIGKESGVMKTIDLSSGNMILEKKFSFYGNAIKKAYLNLDQNRIIIDSSVMTVLATNCEVFMISTEQKLFSLSNMQGADRIYYEYEDKALWECSQNTHYAIDYYGYDYYGYFEGGDYYRIWTIPTYNDIIENLHKEGKKRILTPKERQESGLNLFDL